MRKTKLPALEDGGRVRARRSRWATASAGSAVSRRAAAGACECDRPWAVTFTNPAAHELVGVPLNVPLHPTQLYEAFAEFVIFGFSTGGFANRTRQGGIIGLYLVLYSAARFIGGVLPRARAGESAGRPAGHVAVDLGGPVCAGRGVCLAGAPG